MYMINYYQFLNEYFESRARNEDEFVAYNNLIGILGEEKLIGMSYLEYELNYKNDFTRMFGLTFTNAEWGFFMSAI